MEFALVATLLLLLLLATVELGLVLHTRLLLGTAAREGARQAAVDGGISPRVVDAIARYLEMASIDPGRAEVSVTPASATYGTPVTVTIVYDYRLVAPLVRAVLGPELRLEGRAICRSERLR